jgi:hypothetical protein
MGRTRGGPKEGSMSQRKRIFTLREARALLPQVRTITQAAHTRAAALEAQAAELNPGNRRTEIESQYTAVLRAWVSQVVDLGCEVKGLSLVDFDSGDGLYYCWQHPEEELDYFHDYDAGFAGRKPLGPLRVG